MLKSILITSSILISSTSLASNQSCNFTTEQDRILKLAESYGKSFGYRKTLPAIVMQESFVGSYIVRVNNTDMPYGSYGITHIKLDTAMWLEGITSIWFAKDVTTMRLIFDDIYALRLAVKKLNSVHKGNWRETWSKYNGGSKVYAQKIANHIKLLESCGYFKWS